ncbi:MAG: transcription antitermination factor NusB [Lactobacillales bacterium]|jgi:N utilization substance protein B|nr:transcription antitermination factor NusB [Lactobacillales bacterium]
MRQKLNRHKIREKALQALFLLNFNADLTKEDAMQNALNFEYKDTFIDEKSKNFIPIYLDMLVTGVTAKTREIDQFINEHLAAKWKLPRIAKIDLIILRIAIFEMHYVDEKEVPAIAAINEAIELTKTFSEEKSSKFINGILSSILKEVVVKN